MFVFLSYSSLAKVSYLPHQSPSRPPENEPYTQKRLTSMLRSFPNTSGVNRSYPPSDIYMIYREILSICRAATRAVGVVACYLIPSLRWIRILSATDAAPAGRGAGGGGGRV